MRVKPSLLYAIFRYFRWYTVRKVKRTLNFTHAASLVLNLNISSFVRLNMDYWDQNHENYLAKD